MYITVGVRIEGLVLKPWGPGFRVGGSGFGERYRRLTGLAYTLTPQTIRSHVPTTPPLKSSCDADK